MNLLDLEPKYADYQIQMRRLFHTCPEASTKEFETAKLIRAELDKMGIPWRECGMPTGTLATIKGARPGRTILLRGDIDGLEVTEKTGLEYASKNEGFMHACGHDCHISMLLTAGKILNDLRDRLSGTVVLCFQPAEEVGKGAAAMIADGALEGVDAAFGIHVWSDVPTGHVAVRTGPMMAAGDEFEIEVFGKAGHGAMPHCCSDATLMASAIALNLQTIVSRSVDPMRPAVVTIASIHGGDPKGVSVVPAEVKLAGTTRCAYPEERDLIERRMGEICAGVAATTGTEIDFQYIRLYPPLVNHDEQLEFARQVALEAYGEERVRNHSASMGAEDFAFFLEKRPGCFPRVGIADETHTANHHHPNFDYNDLALGPTADFFVRLVEKRLAALQ